MIERRARTRLEIDQHIIDFDLKTIKPLGRIVNINLGGMLLMSEHPVPLEEHFQVGFSLPTIIKSGKPPATPGDSHGFDRSSGLGTLRVSTKSTKENQDERV